MDKRVMVAREELIAKELIIEVKPGVWRLSKKGKIKALDIFTEIGETYTALVMIATAQAIEEGR